jgi:mRNA interferase RelE/StbE
VNSSQKANYNLVPTKEFLRSLEKLEKQTNQRVIRSIEDLALNPFLGKPLRGELQGLYSLRVGGYRIIYSINTRKLELILHAAKHRSKVYEQ